MSANNTDISGTDISKRRMKMSYMKSFQATVETMLVLPES